MEGWFTDFRVAFCGLGRGGACFFFLGGGGGAAPKRKSVDMIQSGFGEAISFSPSVRFTLMHVYMNTEIK